MSDALNDILLNGEEVLWEGRPDWTRVEKPKSKIKSKIEHFLWIVGLIFAVVLLTLIGKTDGVQGFFQVVLGILITILVIALIPTIGTFFQKDQTEPTRPDERYIITDRRLILQQLEEGHLESFAHNSLQRIERFSRGDVQSMSVQFANGEDDFRTLHALADAEKVERLLVISFIVRKEQS